MSDDTTTINDERPQNDPSGVNTNDAQPLPYVPQPRGESRIPNINLECIDARLDECKEFFKKHVDEADYRNLDWYLWQMQLRFAAGDDIFEIVDDAFLAARCLHDRHAMHLELKPPELFMTRRIVPVELGIISGMPMLTLEFSATYGLPLMMVLGQTAPEDIMSEANLMTSYFRRGFCADYVELTGLSAVIYAGVIAAIGRGFDDEATLGLNTYAKARDSLRGAPPQALLPKIKRYDALNTALACLCAGNFDLIGEILAPEAEDFQKLQAQRAGSEFLSPSKMPPPKYFDLSILTILALAALRGKVIELPQTGAIAAYRDFLRGLTEMPERRIEVPGLDEDARRILQEAGVDPDQLANGYVDNTFRDAKEESEARAAALFEERQRKTQESVRQKLAQDISNHSDEENSDSLDKSKNSEHTNAKSFENFFDDKAFENDANPQSSPADDAAPPAESKDFSAFFDQSNDDEPSNDDRPEPTAQPESKDFSSFFNNENANDEDASIRAHLEEESAAEQDNGKNYAAFFDTLDENAIPAFDDDPKKDDAPQIQKSYGADFFANDEIAASTLKMSLDEPPKVEKKETLDKPKIEPKPYTPTIQDDSPRRDFSKLFDDNIPAPTLGLKMSLDDDDTPKKHVEPKPAQPEPEKQIETTDNEENDTKPSVDYSRFFDDEPQAETNAQAFTDTQAQIRELEAEQAQKQARELERRKNNALKLTDDNTHAESKQPESYQQRMTRLINEKQNAARELALKEREENLKELEALKKQEPQKPKIEQLQLQPTLSTDPDEIHVKVDPEDLTIKGFAYDDLDRIHENTRLQSTLDDDFDLHAALSAQKNEEKQTPSEPDKTHE